ADADGNGRLTKEEYRDYFKRKVAAKADVLAAKMDAQAAKAGDPAAGGKLGGKAGAGLPGWFTTLDADKDGQVSLFEWRKGGRARAVFEEMDLKGEGRLTADEYLG